MTTSWTSTRTKRLTWAGLTAVYLALGICILHWFTPAEDAFILFKYARVLAEERVIAFYPGGPHSEGATDFLWLLAIAAGSWVGFAPPYVALALNTGGFAYIARSWTALRTESRLGQVLLGLSALALPFMPFAAAGLLGFSTTLYAALMLALFRAAAERRLRHVPWLALLLALVRPDGAVIAAGFCVWQAAQLLARRDAAQARTLIAHWIGVALSGAAYFAWRWRYFGQLLPLPLVVKAHYSPPAPGIGDMLDWLASTALPLALLVLGLRLLLRARVERSALCALLPLVPHLILLVPITPLQNIANRFEAPAEICLAYVAALAASRVPPVATWRGAIAILGAVVALLPRLEVSASVIPKAHYMLSFAAELRHSAPNLRIAATEAGALFYDSRGPALDLVGLCSAETAATPPSHALLDHFAPDLLVIHPAGALDEDRIDGGDRRAVVDLADRPLTPMLRPHALAWAVPTPPAYPRARWLGFVSAADGIENIRVAPAAALGWLERRRDRYRIFAAGIGSRFARYHIVAIRSDLPQLEQLVRALERATSAALADPTRIRKERSTPVTSD